MNTRKTKRSLSQPRFLSGKFILMCGNINHNNWLNDSRLNFQVFNYKTSKRVDTKVIDILKEKKLLGEYSSGVCTNCIEYTKLKFFDSTLNSNQSSSDESIQELSMNTSKLSIKSIATRKEVLKLTDSSTQTEPQDDKDIVKYICGRIENKTNSLPQDLVNQLVACIGKKVNKLLVNDVKNVQSIAKDPLLFENFNLSEYIKSLNETITVFIENVCKIDISVASTKELYSFSKLIEHFLSLKNDRCLAPLSLYQNILIYSYTQSKTVLKLINSASPSGSFTTYYNWFDKLGTEKTNCPDGLVIAGFDNNQVIG